MQESYTEERSAINQKLKFLSENKIRCGQLWESCETQISATYPDSKAMLLQGRVAGVYCNVKAAIDDMQNRVAENHNIN